MLGLHFGGDSVCVAFSWWAYVWSMNEECGSGDVHDESEYVDGGDKLRVDADCTSQFVSLSLATYSLPASSD